MNNQHPEQQALSDYVSGKLDEQHAAVVETHVAECPECEVTLQAIEANSDTLVAGLREPEKSPTEVFAREAEYQRAIEQAVNLPEVTGIYSAEQTQSSAAPPQPTDAGMMQKLGPYELVAKLGEGGMGAVYKAQHEHLGKTVAIKILPATAMRDPAMVGRFRREMKAVGALHHPNIVGAHDAGEANGVHFLVMEYVAGKDLSTVLKYSGPLPIEQAISCTLQAARGLEFAHRKGIVHRDIKPANLLLDEEGTLKILDMGLARLDDNAHNLAAQEGLTQTGQVMGTVDYMAPEQAFDTHRADAKADVYSLGCTLYRILTGQNAYAGDTIVQKILAHREKPIPSLRALRSDVPKKLDAIFQRMMAKQPEQRIGMSEVAQELATLQSAPTPATKSFKLPQATASLAAQPAVQSDGGKKRPPVMWLAAGFGGLAAAILLTVVFIIRDKEGNEIARVNGPDGSSVTMQQGTPPDKNAAPSQVTPTTKVPTTPADKNFALKFNGTSAHVLVPTLAFDGQKELTLEATVTYDDPTRNLVREILRLNGKSGSCVLNVAGNSDYLVKAILALPDAAHRAEISIPRIQRTRFAVTVRHESIHLYVDGRRYLQFGSVPRIPKAVLSGLLIGGTPMEYGGPTFHLGTIDEVRISKIARYDGDYTPQDRLESDTDTLALYHFDEGSGDVLKDSSGNGHDGKIIGATWVRADGTSLLALTSSSPRQPVDPAFEQWVTETATLPYTQQLEAFRKKMIELNPGFDGQLTGGYFELVPQIENNAVVSIGFSTEFVKDIRPVQVFTELKKLKCRTEVNTKPGLLVDLSPLKGMKLVSLDLMKNRVQDLTPLVGMPLESLSMTDNPIDDLSPLAGMQLKGLGLNNCGKIRDLSVLKGMPLIGLSANTIKAEDFSVLRGMSLQSLTLFGNKFSDLKLLDGMPLEFLDLGRTQIPDINELAKFTKLKTLLIKEMKLNPAEVAALQAKLPHCKIGWDAPPATSVTTIPTVPPRTPLPDGPTGELVKELKFPDEPAAIALAPDGVHLAAVYREKVQWRNIKDDKVVWERPAAQSLGVNSLKVSPDGKLLVAAGWRQSLMDTVLLLRTSDGQRERAFSTPTGVRSAAISPDSQQLALGLADGTIQILDLTSGMIQHEIKAHLFEVQALTFSPDGNHLASGSPQRADKTSTPENFKYHLKYWNVSDGTEFQTGISPSDFNHYSLRYTPDGKKLVVGSTFDYTFVLGADGKKLKSISSEKRNTGIWNAVPTASNRHGVFGNKIAFVAELDTGKTIFEFPESGIIEGMEVTPDGRFVVTRIDKDSSVYIHRLPAECAAANLSKAVTATSATPSANDAQKFAFEQPDFAAWAAEVGRRDPETQVAMVLKKLQELNPGYDGRETHRIQNNSVYELVLSATKIADLSPVRALTDLKTLKVGGEDQNRGLLKSLAPLAGMKLERLEFYYTDVADLAPLRGMPLRDLICFGTRVTDLGPLAGMPLETLWVYYNRELSDLSPLRGTPLKTLSCSATGIEDLSPLADCPLNALTCQRTKVKDLGPLRGKEFTELDISYTKVSDLAPLETCTKLRKLGIEGLGLPAEVIENLQKTLPNCTIKTGKDIK